MKSTRILLAAMFLAGAVAAWLIKQEPILQAQPQPNQTKPEEQPAKITNVEAGIKAITAEYVKAFNAGDAKAAAELFTKDGEYVGVDDLTLQGREKIAESLEKYLKNHPKAVIEIKIESVRVLSRGLANAQGLISFKMPEDEVASESRYSALHVLENGKWLAASISEWATDPAIDVTTRNLDWLVGEWTSSGEDADLKIVYAWDKNKVFITGKYTLTSKDGNEIGSGTQVLGTNPTGGIRSWMFDSSGTTNDGLWVRDENRWVCESTGLLPDGSEVYAISVIVPIGKDAFTWQTTDREIDGVAVEALPPVKVTRVTK
ncbi:MAG: SgcJ/EcaC family oxidoreductase [Zavarzinella sp.]